MDAAWTEDELDRWFEEDFLDGAPPDVATFAERFGDDFRRLAERDGDLQAFLRAWEDLTDDRGFLHIVKLVNRAPEDAWSGLAVTTKASLRQAHERYLQGQPPPAEVEGALPSLEAPGESAVDDLASTGLAGMRLVRPVLIGGVVVMVTVIVGVFALSGDDAPEPAGASGTPAAEPSEAGTTGGDQGEPVSALPAPRPEADEPATLTLTGDDACGNMASMQDTPVNLAAGPGGQGGQIRLLGPAGMTPEALTGVLTPGADEPGWEDVTGTQDGVEDAQDFGDIVVGDGVITGTLTWTDFSGCTAVFDVAYDVPTVLTEWFVSLPPAAPPDCQFSGELTEDSGQLVVTGVLTDPAGEPMAGGEVVVTVLGSEGLAGTYPAFSGPDGSVRLEVDMPPGKPTSVSVQVTKGAHGLANLFLQ